MLQCSAYQIGLMSSSNLCDSQTDPQEPQSFPRAFLFNSSTCFNVMFGVQTWPHHWLPAERSNHPEQSQSNFILFYFGTKTTLKYQGSPKPNCPARAHARLNSSDFNMGSVSTFFVFILIQHHSITRWRTPTKSHCMSKRLNSSQLNVQLS